jgi:chitodextrinase
MRDRSLVLLMAAAALTAPVPAAFAQTTSTSVSLTWTTPGDDSLSGTAAQFDLRYSTAAITAANFGAATRWTAMPAPAVSGTSQSVTVTGLTPNTTYWFAIKTADEVPNWSAISNVVSRTTLAAPDAVRPAAIATLAITGMTETGATLRWTAVGDDSLTGTATGYDLRYSTAPITAANWASATQVTGEPAPLAPGTTQNATVSGLTRQTHYYFAIRVSDDGGNVSALSNVADGITPDLTRPAAITNLAPGFVWIGPTATGGALAASRERRQDRRRR